MKKHSKQFKSSAKTGLLCFLATSLLLTGCQNNLDRAITEGAQWYLNFENEDFIYYKYYMDDEEHHDGQHSMREMGSLWSITEFYEELGDDELLRLAHKGMDHFSNTYQVVELDDEPVFIEIDEDTVLQFDPHEDIDEFAYIGITPSKNKLGYNGFALLSMLALDPEHEYADGLWSDDKDKWMKLIADGILYQQDPSGELRTFYGEDRDTGKDYYPGEALLGLSKYYQATGDDAVLESIGKAFDYYSNNYWADNPNTAFVPWQTQAYFELYQVMTADEDGLSIDLSSKEDFVVSLEEIEMDLPLLGDLSSDEVAQFIFTMNDFMIEEHLDGGNTFCTGFDFSGIVTSVYIEGMNHAYALADHLGDSQRRLCYGNFIQEGAEHVIGLQYPWGGQVQDALEDKESGLGKRTIEELAEDDPKYGGYIGKPSDFSLQVDRNQHAVMALMRARELGLVR